MTVVVLVTVATGLTNVVVATAVRGVVVVTVLQNELNSVELHRRYLHDIRSGSVCRKLRNRQDAAAK